MTPEEYQYYQYMQYMQQQSQQPEESGAGIGSLLWLLAKGAVIIMLIAAYFKDQIGG